MSNKENVSSEIIDDKIDAWYNDKETKLELHEYLGMSLDEYREWLGSN
jgi:hypothetical protein